MKTLLSLIVALLAVGCAGEVEPTQKAAPSEPADVTDFVPNDCVRVYRVNQQPFELRGQQESEIGCVAFVALASGSIDTRNAAVYVEHFESKPECAC